MLFMPLFLWAGASCVASSLYGGFHRRGGDRLYEALLRTFFVAGAYFSHWEFRSPFLESYLPQWLGRISYSLYLTHWLVFELAQRTLGIWGPVALMPLTFFVGWLVWRFVERPSIRYSRNLGSLFTTSLRHWASPTALPRS
jgi:peptidoglycan/LPS O-acetylase OafA/YrhL